ncbi:hypothetical protein [Shinella sp. BYT-45]|uniref:hypothetical protein n=1 Tax=Shinella sp. BYT-45 TaxID=3377377 RepID=UPI00397EF353
MSPEWMIAFENMRAAGGRREAGPLADPLEREEWGGLQWAAGLLCRLLGGRRMRGPAPSGTDFSDRMPAHDAASHGLRPDAAGRADFSAAAGRRKCVAVAGTAAMQEPSNGL